MFHRAWAFQESLLSRRVLYVCSNELVFECLTEASCQCEDDLLMDHWTLNRRFLFDESSLDSQDYDKSMAIRRWSNYASLHCRRSLTIEQDRHDAFLGIEKKFHHYLGPTVEGIWISLQHLRVSLLWYVHEFADMNTSVSKELHKPRSPSSWSWLSACRANGRCIIWPQDTSNPYTGQVHFAIGRMFYQGPVVKLMEDLHLTASTSRKGYVTEPGEGGLTYFPDNHDMLAKRQDVVVIPLGRNQYEWCLVLRQTNCTGIYRRVGLARSKSWLVTEETVVRVLEIVTYRQLNLCYFAYANVSICEQVDSMICSNRVFESMKMSVITRTDMTRRWCLP